MKDNIRNFNIERKQIIGSVFFSIIVPTCNRLHLISRCLDRLKPGAQSISAFLYEVIVSDDSLDVGTEILIKENYPWVIYTKGSRFGPAANRNNGASIAKGNWLIFTDDDCLPNDNWLEEYLKIIDNNSKCLAFEGAILPDDWNLLKYDMAECPVNERGGLFWSANIAIKSELFWIVEGFTELFPVAANEDQELTLKLKRYTEITFCSNAIVVHPVRLVKLIDKIKRLPNSERSQIYLSALKGHSGIKNYFDGLRIHLLAAINEVKKLHFKRVSYNLLGLVFRIVAGAFIIIKVQKQLRGHKYS